MNRRLCLLVVGLAAATCAGLAAAQAAATVSDLKSLGQERYQIGRIVVDKRAGAFVVPGRVHVTGKPLEYLATSPGGMKEYESLLELDATGSEFNLACILIGLEPDPKQVPFQQFSQAPLVGPRVALYVSWSDGTQQRKVTAAEALLNADSGVKPESIEWLYTGSPAPRPKGRFGADIAGTLIGFVHDANSVIESAVGVGIGAYGSVRGSSALPAPGSPIELTVEVAQARR